MHPVSFPVPWLLSEGNTLGCSNLSRKAEVLETKRSGTVPKKHAGHEQGYGSSRQVHPGVLLFLGFEGPFLQDPFLPCPCPTQQSSSLHLILKKNKIRETECRWCRTPIQQCN